jgi:cell division septum initiation protein DivIVA
VGISEQDINVDLPRAVLGGIKRDAVEDLLRQIARDYRRLEQENARLWQTLEGFERRPKEAPQSERSVTVPGAPASGPAAAQAAPTVTAGNSMTLEHESLAARPAGSQAMPSRHEPEDMPAIVLSLAQRAARELRESTREECELMLKKARVQADRIERELGASVAELEEIQALGSALCDQLRSSLHSLLPIFVDDNDGDPSALRGRARRDHQPGDELRLGPVH